MLSFIARNGGVEVGAAASARQHIHHDAGDPLALPTHRGAGGSGVWPLWRSPRTRVERDQAS